MDRLEIVLTIISVVSSFSSILFAFLAFKRNSNGDNKREGKNEGAFLADISYIKKSMERNDKALDKLEEKFSDLQERMIKMEQKMEDHFNRDFIHIKGTKANE